MQPDFVPFGGTIYDTGFKDWSRYYDIPQNGKMDRSLTIELSTFVTNHDTWKSHTVRHVFFAYDLRPLMGTEQVANMLLAKVKMKPKFPAPEEARLPTLHSYSPILTRIPRLSRP